MLAFALVAQAQIGAAGVRAGVAGFESIVQNGTQTEWDCKVSKDLVGALSGGDFQFIVTQSCPIATGFQARWEPLPPNPGETWIPGIKVAITKSDGATIVSDGDIGDARMIVSILRRSPTG